MRRIWELIPDWRESRIFPHSDWWASKKEEKKRPWTDKHAIRTVESTTSVRNEDHIDAAVHKGVTESALEDLIRLIRFYYRLFFSKSVYAVDRLKY